MWRALERMRAEGLDGPSAKAHAEGRSPWLTSAKLKLVDACNLRCMMCDYWRGRRRGELTTLEVRRVLDSLGNLGCKKVHFTGGELFLRKDALELISYAAALGMRTNLTTNGTLLKRDRITALLRIPARSVTLSIDSPVAGVHDRVRGVDGAWAKTIKTLDRLLARRKPKTRVRLNTVVSRTTFDSLIEAPRFFRDRHVDGWLLIPMDGAPNAPGTMRAEDIRAYNAHVAPVLAETIRVPGFDPWIYGRGEADATHAAQQRYARGFYEDHLCRVPWFHTLIDARGEVFACCMSRGRGPALGNVRAQPLEAIWNGPTYVAFRRRMARRRLEVCHQCDDFLAENRGFAEFEGGPRSPVRTGRLEVLP